ncbi:GbsR/MarR family transcriptional regulator, partial [Xanthovirga aplysinae]|uniref:GbsR/MarR family transcriptional regulator n=1 Tax=Xanthovirga aplysinae TaxID=2529853 RepID=UPI001657603E
AKQKYIQAWGSLGSSWGINRTMAQIHALLLISKDPMSTDQIMDELQISRGNANMNIRMLIDWGLVNKILIPGDRKEYFITDKDIMNLGVQVARERKKRELEPIIRMLNEVKDIEGSGKDVEVFKTVTGDLLSFAKQSETFLNTFINSNKNWFFKIISKIKI